MKFRSDYCCNSSSSSFVCQRTKIGIVDYDYCDKNYGYVCEECNVNMAPEYWILPSKEDYLEEYKKLGADEYYLKLFESNYDYWIQKRGDAASVLLAQYVSFNDNLSIDEWQYEKEDDHFKEATTSFLDTYIPKCFCPYCSGHTIYEKEYIQVLLTLPENKHLIIEGVNNNTLNRRVFEEKGFILPYRTCEVVSLCNKIVSMEEAIKLTKSKEYNHFSMDRTDFNCSDDAIDIHN